RAAVAAARERGVGARAQRAVRWAALAADGHAVEALVADGRHRLGGDRRLALPEAAFLGGVDVLAGRGLERAPLQDEDARPGEAARRVAAERLLDPVLALQAQRVRKLGGAARRRAGGGDPRTE